MKFINSIQSALEYHKGGNLRQAELIYKKILKIHPNDVDALHLLGVLCNQLGDYDSAIKYIKKALKNDTTFAEAYNSLGNAKRNKGLIDEAENCYQKALQLNPDLAIAANNLGNIYSENKNSDKAIFYLKKACQINPSFAEAYNNLGKVFYEIGQFVEAMTYCKKAIQLNPNYSEAYYNLGTILTQIGRLSEADTYLRRALQISPNFLTAYQNLLFNMNYHSKNKPQDIYSEHLVFAKQFAEPLYPYIMQHTNSRLINRQLKIGYVSADFRKHPVAYFIEPVISTHNREHFEVFCYTNSLEHDEVTKRFQDHADNWRNIVGMSDKDVVEQIRKDGIDILVDLAGHTGGNRILVFAHKPSPIQVSWIGYPNTTGISTVDYRLVDEYTDPVGLTDPYYSEKLIRIPQCFLCYLPDHNSPEIGNLPAMTSGYITFGSFNFFAKVSPEVIECWTKILKAVPNSRIILKTKSFSDISIREYAMQIFIQKGIARERIELLPYVPSYNSHLNVYNRIDISLDTFPYNGTTTTCEAIWMGVPVITLAGNIHSSRVGLSVLSNIGLQELIANSNKVYVELAVNLANDLERLQSFRSRSRETMKQSPLCDKERFTVNLEMCYRRMWEKWCESG